MLMRFFLTFLLQLACAMIAAATLPRVAVVAPPDDAGLNAFEVLLTAELSKSADKFELVERGELQRLVKEASLPSEGAEDRSLALARLAKADGLIFIGRDNSDSKKPKLTLRLSSTLNGLIARSLVIAGEEAGLPEAARLAAAVLNYPCERLGHDESRPPLVIAMMGLNPEFEADRDLKTTINLAISQQLSSQQGFAVAERWKMDDLVFERSMVPLPVNFATSSLVLDGSYVRKGDRIAADMRLRRREPAADINIHVEALASKLPELAAEIARRIAKECDFETSMPAWNAVEEGRQYAELGSWLLGRKLWEESAQAYESAVALGFVEKFVLPKRARAYEAMILPEPAFQPGRTEVEGLDKISKPSFRRILMTAIRQSHCIMSVMDAKWGGLTEKELSRSERHFLVQEHFSVNLMVLQALCMRGEQLEWGEEARELRRLSRKLISQAEGEFGVGAAANMAQRAYMHDTPEEAIADLRARLNAELLADEVNDKRERGLYSRFYLWGTSEEHRLLRAVDWSSLDNRRGDEALKAFISELQSSDHLLTRIDGLAIAYQENRDEHTRAEILKSYCTLLEDHREELRTREGQMTFYAFGSKWMRMGGTLRPRFHERFARIFLDLLENADWVEPPVFEAVYQAVRFWSYDSETSAGNPVPEVLAAKILEAYDAFLARARHDPRWKQYENGSVPTVARDLFLIPDEISKAYPEIRRKRIQIRPAVPGAIPLRVWAPTATAKGDHPAVIHGDLIQWSGTSLLVPCEGWGILSLDVETMTVNERIRFPNAGNSIDGLAAVNGALMVNQKRELFVRSSSEKDEKWTKVETPGVMPDDSLNWYISAVGNEFFVGSVMTGGNAPRMLAGKVRNGQLTWLASSNRRPPLTPLDTMDPRSVLLAYRNSAGNTMLYLDCYGDTPVVELGTGKVTSSLPDLGKVQSKGDMPLYWNIREIGMNDGARSLLAFDPALEQPRLLIKSPSGMPARWKDVKPVFDRNRPELLGQFLSPIVYGGKLWILKREADVPGRSQKDGPNDFRLVCAGLEGGECAVIPLRFEVSEEIRKLVEADKKILERPVINPLSLTATPKGLFFTPAGLGYGSGVHPFGGIPSGGRPSPVLFYVTWTDIHAWLEKNAPAVPRAK